MAVRAFVKTEALGKSDGRATEDPSRLGLHIILEHISQ